MEPHEERLVERNPETLARVERALARQDEAVVVEL